MRLIDADIVLSPKMWDGNIPNDAPKEVEEYIKGLYERIKNLPTVDAEPIRHGYWEFHALSIKNVPTESCSECGEWSYGDNEAYCPCCGAKMDGVEE